LRILDREPDNGRQQIKSVVSGLRLLDLDDARFRR
jgi:hypothetical protein